MIVNEATPRPWRVDEDSNVVTSWSTRYEREVENGEKREFSTGLLALVYGQIEPDTHVYCQPPANASLIVAAVNSYDAYRKLAEAATALWTPARTDAVTIVSCSALAELKKALAAVDAAEKEGR
jgi:hypothetical protein